MTTIYSSIWVRADDAHVVGELYTLHDLIVWSLPVKGFLPIDSNLQYITFIPRPRVFYLLIEVQ